MKTSTFATSFYIKRSAVRNRDGKAPIMVKISIDGDDKALGTKLFVTPDLWENGKAKGKSAEATEINGQLKEVSARLTNHYHRILREEDFVTAEKLRNAFLVQPFCHLPLGEEETNRYGLQGTDKGDYHRFR